MPIPCIGFVVCVPPKPKSINDKPQPVVLLLLADTLGGLKRGFSGGFGRENPPTPPDETGVGVPKLLPEPPRVNPVFAESVATGVAGKELKSPKSKPPLSVPGLGKPKSSVFGDWP